MDSLISDIRFALRTLAKAPGFALAAVLTLALGIGANTTMFSVVRAVLLRPLPYPQPDRLATAFTLYGTSRWTVSPPDFTDWRERNHVFSDAAAYYGTSYTLTGAGNADQTRGATGTASFFKVLDVAPALGRTFAPDEATPGHDKVVVLSDELWRDRFGADPSLVGRPITLDGEAYTVIGVMPRGFAFPAAATLWTPLSFTPQALATQRGAHYLTVLARLRAGVTVDQASRDISAIAVQLTKEYPTSNPGSTGGVVELVDAMTGPVRPALYILLGAVAIVLAIACTNVANLLLARGLGRESEMAVRTALGASRGRIVRGLVTESMVLGVLGGAAGLLLATWGTALVTRYHPGNLPRIAETAVDGSVLGVTVGLSLLTGLLFGTLPAWQTSRAQDLSGRLKEGGRSRAGRHDAKRSRSALVVAEVGLAVVLLAGAGLLLRSFVRLRSVEPGFDPTNVTTFAVSLPQARYPAPAQVDAFYRRLTERLTALPGVTAAGGTMIMPLSGNDYSISVEQLDGAKLAHDAAQPSVEVRAVTPGYASAMRIPVRRGRGFTDQDEAGSLQVALVNEAAAQLLWPGQDPLGHHVQLGTRLLGPQWPYFAGGEIVGVVGDVHDQGLGAPPSPTVYVSSHQFPVTGLTYGVRSAGDPGLLTRAIGEAVTALDPNVPVYRLRTMTDLMDSDVAQPRLYFTILAGFAFAALALAGLGIYAVIAYGVRQRTQEIGVRLALGAGREDVVRLVVRGGLALAGVGIALGLAVTLIGGRVLSAILAARFPNTPLLYKTAPTDAVSLAGAAVVFLLVALAASYIPARRAAGTDPMEALRYE